MFLCRNLKEIARCAQLTNMDVKKQFQSLFIVGKMYSELKIHVESRSEKRSLSCCSDANIDTREPYHNNKSDLHKMWIKTKGHLRDRRAVQTKALTFLPLVKNIVQRYDALFKFR